VSASNRKTCLTEKFFVCLACIFEWKLFQIKFLA
jgi:hypothetical protein